MNTKCMMQRTVLALAGALIAGGALAMTVRPPSADASVPAPAQDAQPLQAMASRRAPIIDELVTRGDADSLFTAAMLMVLDTSAANARRMALLDEAAMLAPDNATITTFALRVCRATKGCDVNAHVAQAQFAAPDDARYLVPALIAARKRKDDAALTRILKQMAAQTTLDSQWVDARSHADDALATIDLSRLFPPQRVAMAPAQVAQLVKVGLITASASRWAYSTGLYTTLAKACKPHHPAFAARRNACGRIGAMLQASGTLIDNYIGLRLAAWTSTDAAERAAIDRRRTQIHWQMDSLWANADRQHPHRALQRELRVLAAERATGSEIGGVEAVMRQLGMPLDPPPGWHGPGWRGRQTHESH